MGGIGLPPTAEFEVSGHISMQRTKREVPVTPAPMDQERLALEVVSIQLSAEGYVLGDFEYEAGDAKVDFTFPDGHPVPVAMEVTTLRTPHHDAGAVAVQGLKDLLNDLAHTEAWECCWFVAVNLEADMRNLGPRVAELIRHGVEIRPGDYSAQDLVAAGSSEGVERFLDLHRELESLGLVHLHRVPEASIKVDVLGMGSARAITWHPEPLERAIAENGGKLGRVPVGYERHLVVEVVAWDRSADPAVAPVPELPDSIDCLWIVHRWAASRTGSPLWWCRRGEGMWRVAN